MKSKLDRWIIQGNLLVGYLYDHPSFAPGTRVMTDAIVHINLRCLEARCIDGDYKLGEMGTVEEHNTPLLGITGKEAQYLKGPAREKKIIVGV